MAGLAAGERERGQAQQRHADGYTSRNQNQAGDVLQGPELVDRSDTGQRQSLAYIGPNQGYVDHQTGNRYWRDEAGRMPCRCPRANGTGWSRRIDAAGTGRWVSLSLGARHSMTRLLISHERVTRERAPAKDHPRAP